MAASLASVLPRVAVLVGIWLLATSTITFAAAGRQRPPVTTPPAAAPAPPEILVVPDVRRQAYVFAKGILDDAGFAWRVAGRVQGYAVNTVETQSPAPGTRVVDTGAPTIVLRLARNGRYDERGLPEESSPHRGTKVVLPSEVAPNGPGEAPEEAPAEETPAPDAPADEAPSGGESGKPKKDAKTEQESRAPAFHVPGAPAEPKDEMSLSDRARLLERRLKAHPEPSRALVRYWLYQHAWIVTGARFGWHDGAEALQILIRVDRWVQAKWEVGRKSEAVARAALAEVEQKAGT